MCQTLNICLSNGNAIHPLNSFSLKSGSHAGFLSFPHSTHPVHQPSWSPPLRYLSIPSTSLYPDYTHPDLNHCHLISIRTTPPAGSTLALLSSIFHTGGFSIIYNARWSDPASHSHFVSPCYSQTHRHMDFLVSLYVKNSPPLVFCTSCFLFLECSATRRSQGCLYHIIPTSTQCYFLREAFPDQPV